MQMPMMNQTFLKSFFAVVIIDQVSKFLVQDKLEVLYNNGVSFGFLGGNKTLLAVALVAVMIGVWYCCKQFWLKYPLLAGMLFGGGISNVLDRILYPGVRDWLSVPGMNIKNNLADWAIFIAIISILYLELVKQRQEQDQKRHAKN